MKEKDSLTSKRIAAKTPSVTIVVIGALVSARSSSTRRTLDSIDVQTLKDVQVLLADETPNWNLVSGEYVLTMRAGVRLATPLTLERLYLTAKVEDADAVQGEGLEGSERFVRRECLASERHKSVNIEGAILCRPVVSAIVPAYNVERYLTRCLQSLASQTLKEIEIICVDDGSTDGTGVVADRSAERFSGITVIHRENGGLSAARNSGMDVAIGKFVGFVDGDDWVDPEMYKELSDILIRDCDAEIAMCGAKVEFSYAVSAREVEDQNAYFSVPCEGGRDLDPAMVWSLNVSACTKLYRRDFLLRNGIRFPEGMNNEDEVFFFMTMARAHRVQLLRERWYHYIRNEGGIMTTQVKQMEDAQVLPDGLTRSLPVIFEFLKWDDRLDLIGIAFRRLCGIANRFPNEETYRLISKLLHKYDFRGYSDFIDARDAAYVPNRLNEIYNWDASSADLAPVDESLFPAPRLPVAVREDDPLLSFVVPVFNVDHYISRCLESLRHQTEKRIEIICVDDGSTDDSAEILDRYAKSDSRIRVFHRENHGAALTRNFGMTQARGRYVSFIDGDDWVERNLVAETVSRAELLDLDVCFFDLEAFDYRTKRPIPLYWTVANHRPFFAIDTVFSPQDLSEWRFSASPCMAIYRREFLVRNRLEFPAIKICEDGAFIYRMLACVKRASTIDKVYYHYRRGNPTSAVSRLTAGRASTEANDAQVAAMVELSAIYRQVYRGNMPESVRKTFLRRLLVDVLFYAEKSASVRRWFNDVGMVDLDIASLTEEDLGERLQGRIARLGGTCAGEEVTSTSELLPIGLPATAMRMMSKITRARHGTQKDLYIVTGQLNSTTNEPIDSWTFFRWLQDHDIPSRYVIWRNHEFYAKIKAQGLTRDVIALKGDGVGNFEFLKACSKELERAKVVIQENGALNEKIRQWLYALDGCEYVFMQHGVFFTWLTAETGRYLATFNLINVASERERVFIERYLPPESFERGDPFVLGGLPRWDSLVDASGEIAGEKVVFVMFTWRKSFNEGLDRIKKSAYYHGLHRLLAAENVARLSAKGVRIVLAAHHHLSNHVKDLDFDVPVELVPSSDISYWIRHAVACVTDFSSVSIDFMFQNKPTIFWVPDAADELLDRGVPDDGGKVMSAVNELKGLYNVVESPEEVIDALSSYADRQFVLEPEKRATAETFFSGKSGICARLYHGIEEKCAQDDKEAM